MHRLRKFLPRHHFWAIPVILLLSLVQGLSAAVVVSHVRAEQRPGTTIVDIYYDVTALAPTVIVSLQVRDGLGTWGVDVPSTSATGHLGASVPTGTYRHIVWDAGVDGGRFLNGTQEQPRPGLPLPRPLKPTHSPFHVLSCISWAVHIPSLLVCLQHP